MVPSKFSEAAASSEDEVVGSIAHHLLKLHDIDREQGAARHS